MEYIKHKIEFINQYKKKLVYVPLICTIVNYWMRKLGFNKPRTWDGKNYWMRKLGFIIKMIPKDI